ncbi:MAG: hypothetical protein M1823_000907 [Watsoniomyces obsoletus]|nr:MAG: hypothetical protein M1823_000907 [Watsoniomyces obsoletus]
MEEIIRAQGGSSQTSRDAGYAIEILSLFAFYHNESVMEEMFKRAAENQVERNDFPEHALQDSLADGSTVTYQLLKVDDDGMWDPEPFRAGISTLLSFSLIKRDQRARFFSMHVLVHSWAQNRLSDPGRQRRLRIARCLVSKSIVWEFLSDDYTYRRKLLPHVEACQRHTVTSDIDDSEECEQAENYALVLFEAGQWEEARKLRAQVMETRQRVSGQEHPDTLASMTNLASTYGNQGRWQEAEELEVQVMETRQRVLGREHPDTLTIMANLAWTWRSQGSNNKALLLMQTCAELRKQKLGMDHPHTILSVEATEEWVSEI